MRASFSFCVRPQKMNCGTGVKIMAKSVTYKSKTKLSRLVTLKLLRAI